MCNCNLCQPRQQAGVIQTCGPTHYEGCPCHEARRDETAMTLRAEIEALRAERDRARAELERLRRVLSTLNTTGVSDDVMVHLAVDNGLLRDEVERLRGQKPLDDRPLDLGSDGWVTPTELRKAPPKVRQEFMRTQIECGELRADLDLAQAEVERLKAMIPVCVTCGEQIDMVRNQRVCDLDDGSWACSDECWDAAGEEE